MKFQIYTTKDPNIKSKLDTETAVSNNTKDLGSYRKFPLKSNAHNEPFLSYASGKIVYFIRISGSLM